MSYGSVHGRRHRKKGWLKRKKPAYYGDLAGTKAQHRERAGSFATETRRLAQKTRAAARSGDCRTALHLFGLTTFTAGFAAAERTHAVGASKHFRGGSRMGALSVGLQKTVFKACRIG